MILSSYTLALLDDIERRIDPETEEDYRKQWKAFWYKDPETSVFIPKRKITSSPGTELKSIYINDALKDPELMLDAQLIGVSSSLAQSSSALGIRANYGTGIMTSLFGAEVFTMPYELNTLPTTRSLNDSDRIRHILDQGIPDFYNGFGKDVLFFGEYCAEIFEKYPNIRKYVEVYHPDTQGPLDIAELLWGSEMFYEMYDDPDFVHSVLRLVTDTYKGFMDKWYSIIPKRQELSVHWGLMHRGTILLRLDSAMNLSPDFYEEFSKPYDRELFDYYDGGCMHFCGRGDHYIKSLCDIENMYGINMSQPHLNNMNVILDAVSSGNKRILSLPDAALYAEQYPLCKGLMHSDI